MSSCQFCCFTVRHACLPPCPQVFALKNGNRGRDGREQGRNAPTSSVMSYNVDMDKVGQGLDSV